MKLFENNLEEKKSIHLESLTKLMACLTKLEWNIYTVNRKIKLKISG